MICQCLADQLFASAQPRPIIVKYSHVAPFLTAWQHRFVKGRLCATQLVITHHQSKKALDDGLQVDVVFLDFAKAFDRVSHVILLQKLYNFGISGSLLNWCKDYLTEREQRVVIQGQSSTSVVCHSFWFTPEFLIRAIILYALHQRFT